MGGEGYLGGVDGKGPTAGFLVTMEPGRGHECGRFTYDLNRVVKKPPLDQHVHTSRSFTNLPRRRSILSKKSAVARNMLLQAPVERAAVESPLLPLPV